MYDVNLFIFESFFVWILLVVTCGFFISTLDSSYTTNSSLILLYMLTEYNS